MKNTNLLLRSIRDEIANGDLRVGEYLPSLRELGGRHELCAETVRKSLKKLVTEGLIQAIPRRGFKVKDRHNNNTQQIAFLTRKFPDLSDAQKATWACANAIYQAGENFDVSILGLHLGGKQNLTIADQIKNLNLKGIVIDSTEEEVVRDAKEVGFPIVMVNSMVEDMSVDVIIQDNYYGGFNAVQHFIDAGIEKIAWLGTDNESCHARERFAGVRDGIAFRNRPFKGSWKIKSSDEQMKAKLTKVLKEKDRPEAIISFGSGISKIVKEVADSLKLKIGKDLHVMGWCVNEYYREEHKEVFHDCPTPPAMVWKASDMAMFAIERLMSLHDNMHQPPVRINIPVKLKL